MSVLSDVNGDSKIRVLLADDSAMVRHILAQSLNAHPRIEVIDEAKDGIEAVEKVMSLSPDVLVLDVEMPKLNGIAALREIMSKHPLPVVMFSSLTKRGAEITLEALSRGAVDFLLKPGSREDMVEITKELGQKILTASTARYGLTLRRNKRRFRSVVKKRRFHATSGFSDSLVIIGSSTGGPHAVENLLGNLPKEFGGCVLVCQHMPSGFTGSFAKRLDKICHIPVKEGEDGDQVLARTVMVAPGGIHTRLRPGASRYETEISTEMTPPVHGVRPCVDLALFDAASLYGNRLMVVILSGMGFDGAKGAMKAKRNGATVVCQDQLSSVVWGMPRACLEMGVVDKVLPPDKIAGVMHDFVLSAEDLPNDNLA